MAGASGTALSPLLETALGKVCDAVNSRRRQHAADVHLDGAAAYCAQTEADFLGFVERALADPQRHELLVRALTIAQDAALRDKRRALGLALAAGVSDGARV